MYPIQRPEEGDHGRGCVTAGQMARRARQTTARHDRRGRPGAGDRPDVLRRRSCSGFVSNPIIGAGCNRAGGAARGPRRARDRLRDRRCSPASIEGAGAVYEYLTTGAHPAVGIFAAGIFFVGTLFLGGGGIYLGLGILTQRLLGDAHHHIDVCPRLVGARPRRCSWPSCSSSTTSACGMAIGAMLDVRGDLVHRRCCSWRSTIIVEGRRGREHADQCSTPGHDLSVSRRWRAQRRAARHPAVRRLRGSGLDRRGEPRPASLDPARAAGDGGRVRRRSS